MLTFQQKAYPLRSWQRSCSSLCNAWIYRMLALDWGIGGTSSRNARALNHHLVCWIYPPLSALRGQPEPWISTVLRRCKTKYLKHLKKRNRCVYFVRLVSDASGYEKPTLRCFASTLVLGRNDGRRSPASARTAQLRNTPAMEKFQNDFQGLSCGF